MKRSTMTVAAAIELSRRFGLRVERIRRSGKTFSADAMLRSIPGEVEVGWRAFAPSPGEAVINVLQLAIQEL